MIKRSVSGPAVAKAGAGAPLTIGTIPGAAVRPLFCYL